MRDVTKTLRKALATAVLVSAAALAMPGAANASSIYPPTDACTADATVTAGGVVTFSCDAATFAANEPVTVTITGENGSDASFAFVKFALSTGAYTTQSGASGELPGVSITLPNDAEGVYNIAAISPSSAGGTASVTIVSDDGDPLANTGGDGTTLALWAGGAVVLLAGGAAVLAVAARKRRDRD